MGIDLDHAELALGQVGKLDLLDSDRLARAPVECLVDGAERSLADAVAESLLYRPSQAKVSKHPTPRTGRSCAGGMEQLCGLRT